MASRAAKQPKRKDTGAPIEPATMKLSLTAGANEQPTWQPIGPPEGPPGETVFSTSPESSVPPPNAAPAPQSTAMRQPYRKQTVDTSGRKATVDTMAMSTLGHASKPSDAFTLGADDRNSGHPANQAAPDEKAQEKAAQSAQKAKRRACCF